jgi:PAS domain S-box-containing protein
MPDERETAKLQSLQAALQSSEELFHALFNLAAVGMAQVSPAGGWLRVNQKLCDILGYPPGELLQLGIPEISRPEELASHQEQIQRLLAGEISGYAGEKRVRRKSGPDVWVYLTVALVRTPEGAPKYFIAIVEDIEQRKQAEQQLLESEGKFRKVFSLAPIGMTISSLSDGRFVEINAAGERLSGYPRAEVVGRSSAQFDIWASAEERTQVIEEVLKKGEVRDREMVMKDKGGHVFWGSFSAVVIEIRGEKHLLSLVSDIAERKRAQEVLRESEERFRLLADAAPVIIWESDSDGRLTFLNRTGQEFTGRDLEQEIGEGWTQGVHPEDLERCLKTFLDAVRDRTAFCMEYRLRRADGSYGWLAETAIPRFALMSGALLGYIGTCVDISESKQIKERLQQANRILEQRVAERTAELRLTVKRLQDEISERIRMGQALEAETSERLSVQQELREKELLLQQQSRLAAMGEMISNIAHQWRQPLNLLALLAQELPVTYKTGAFNLQYLQHSVDKTLETIGHMSQTIDDFRNFFRPYKEKVAFNMVEVIKKTISLMEGSLTSQKIETTISHDRDAMVHGYPNEFSQVLLNILINARDAFVERGVASPKITLELDVQQGRTVVTITDNAGGIPEPILDRVFDPYFTTKGPDKGTGVGLFMSKTIVEKSMCGSLTARNVQGGAQFRIELPAGGVLQDGKRGDYG